MSDESDKGRGSVGFQ